MKIDEILDELFLQVLIAHSKSEGKRLYYLARDKAKSQLLAEAEKMALEVLGEYEKWLLSEYLPKFKTTPAWDFARVTFIPEFLMKQNIHDKFRKEVTK